MSALARHTDPATSHEAAAAVGTWADHIEMRVLYSLRAAGAAGRTLDELVEQLGIEKVTVSPRLRPLCKKHLAADSGAKRLGHSGRKQTVWTATEDSK